MIKYYNWLVCKLFKRCHLHVEKTPAKTFAEHCEKEPWSCECRIYED